MSVSLQIFIYATDGITRDNNFPLLCFSTPQAKLAFISRLVSRPRGTLLNEYFEINNPQLLPREIRKKHRYQGSDGVFTLYENWDAFADCETIDDNTLELTGFTSVLRARDAFPPPPPLQIQQ